MRIEDEIRDEIEDFFERTCINDYIFNQNESSNFLRMKKKTPVGTWRIKSVELGYFINSDDQVSIGILNEGNDEISQIVARILRERAKKIK